MERMEADCQKHWFVALCQTAPPNCARRETGLFLLEHCSVFLMPNCCQTTQGEYYEAICKDIDPQTKEMVCCFPSDSGFPEACFKLQYDILIIGVGMQQQQKRRTRLKHARIGHGKICCLP